MTPYGFAQQCADDLATLPLPAEFHPQLGDIVVPCAGTYVSVMTVTPIDPHGPGTGNCDVIEFADMTVVAARDCANVANDDGSTNWQAQDAVSTQMDADGDLLWEWAAKQQAFGWYRTGTPSLSYTIQGGMAMTTLGVQLPIP